LLLQFNKNPEDSFGVEFVELYPVFYESVIWVCDFAALSTML
jgi:hypothetical protein